MHQQTLTPPAWWLLLGVVSSGLMLRGGRLSERALQRLLSTQQQDIAGYVVGELDSLSDCLSDSVATANHYRLPGCTSPVVSHQLNCT